MPTGAAARAIDAYGNPVDFLLAAKRDLDAAKLFPLDAEGRALALTFTDGANTCPTAIRTSVDSGLLHPDRVHYVTKHVARN